MHRRARAARQRIRRMSVRSSGAQPNAAETSATTPAATGKCQKWRCRPGWGSAAPQGQGRAYLGMREANTPPCVHWQLGGRQRCRKGPIAVPLRGAPAAARAATIMPQTGQWVPPLPQRRPGLHLHLVRPRGRAGLRLRLSAEPRETVGGRMQPTSQMQLSAAVVGPGAEPAAWRCRPLRSSCQSLTGRPP